MVQGFAIGFALLLAVAGAVHAQGVAASDPAPGYPARPIRLIVPFPPGGSNDIMARYFAHYLTERLGRQVVVDNRAGADAIIGTEIASRAQPDGHTLLMASAAFAVNGATRKLPYDPLKSFSWVGTLGFGPSVLSVGPALKVNSAKELIAHGKANPGKLTLATSGGYAQFATELFNHLSGMKMLVVIYKGGFPALMDVDGRAGARQPRLADPDAAAPEVGQAQGARHQRIQARRRRARPSDHRRIRRDGLRGEQLVGRSRRPPARPRGVIAKLSAEMTRYLKLPETLKRFEAEGVEADIRTPDRSPQDDSRSRWPSGRTSPRWPISARVPNLGSDQRNT